jgi:HAD superfamily hydrolase (TIGR01484 family)
MSTTEGLSGAARCLVVFDVDSSLLPLNGPPSRPVLVGLQALRKAGARLALASGKPCVYLSGLVRGMDIMDACLIGENGADIWLTSTMPPRRLLQLLEAGERQALERLRAAAIERFGDRVFLQPNAIGVTAFPADTSLAPAQVAQALGDAAGPELTLYVHADSADWALSRFNKGQALRLLAAHLQIPCERVFAVGDGLNDLCMAQVAAQMWWLGPPELLPAHATPAQAIEEAVWGVLERVRGLD